MTSTLTDNPPQQPASSSAFGVHLPPDLEPDEEWKARLKVEIEDGFRSMYEEAKQNRNNELAKRVVSEDEREEINKQYNDTVENIRKLATEHFRAALERERQERRWAAGEQLDQAWSEGMIKEQQAILDRIEKERKMKATQPQLPQPRPPSQQPAQTQPKPDKPDTLSAPQRKVERVARTPTQVAESERDGGGNSTYFTGTKAREPDDIGTFLDDVPPIRPTGKARAGSITSIGSYKPPSFLDTERPFFGRSGSSALYDEPEAMPRSVRSPADVPDTTRRESIRRKPSMGTRPVIPEIWKPSITPEEDAQMSRTFTLARRSSVTSTTSSWRAPSVLNAAFSDPLDATNSNMERERAGIQTQDQEWSNLDKAREKEKQSPAYPENRPGLSTPQRLDERVGMAQTTSTPPNAIPYARSNDSSRSYSSPFAPPPSASRPIVNKKSFSIDDGYPSQSSPSTRNWNPPSRSPYETRFEGSSSRSPQTPDDFPRSWQSSNLRGRFSSQDMRYNYLQQEGGSGYTGRYVHTHHEEDFEDQSDDGMSNANWRAREYNDRRIMEIEESLRAREEAANKKEAELKKRAEELRREEEARKLRTEELKQEEEARKLRAEGLKKEEEAKRSEEEASRKDEDMRRKEEDAKRKEDEIRRKELDAMRKEVEVRRKEEEAKKKERDVKLKEEEAKRKEREARLREMEARRKEEEARRKEEEVRMIEEEARRKESEAKRKQEEALRKEREAARKEEEATRKEEEARQKAEEARRKEEELQKREEELKRREEDLNRREAEARRREEDKQKVQQEEFRKREEEIRRQRAEEKKRQDSFAWESWGTSQESFRPTPPPQTSTPSAPWPIPNRNDRSTSATSPNTDRSSTNSSRSTTTSTTTGWTSTSARSTSTAGTPATPTSNTPKPAAGTSSTPKPAANSTPNPPLTEAEFHRRQAEQAQQREEQFRREQARLAMQEHERQAKSGKMMSKQEVAKLFEAHRGQWDKIPTLTSLIWEDFPWPMFKRPNGPEDLTDPAVTAYMLSPIHQDKGAKERIKEALRKWHPDRFETSHLPKVKPDERGKVSAGAGAVVRILNYLLNKSGDLL